MAVNPDLTEERRAATFDIVQLSHVLYGDEEGYRRRREIMDFVESKPEFQDPRPKYTMDRLERVDNVARKARAMMKYREKLGVSSFDEGLYFANIIFGVDPHPLGLHFTMFMPAIQGQATDEQQDEWMPQVLTGAVIGTYAQTEIGHGTFLRGLETLAIYDRATEQFIMRSPTVTSTKCWPGNLGKFSNVAVVMAQLVIDDKQLGPHPFYVPLRDPITHEPLPGVEIGDIGPKFGYKSNDNGYLRLHDVRIPRKNMLMKNSQVLPDGSYVKPAHSKMSYGAMMFVRSIMASSQIFDQADHLAKAATIATRYSCVRRQGEITPGAGEVKLLDYETQQFRVLTALSTAFAYWFTGVRMRQLYMDTMSMTTEQLVITLPDLHAVSSGLKSCVSWDVCRAIEQCRQACGGHGYADYSGIPGIYTQAIGGCTYEGDNLVMLLQVARSLMKALKANAATASVYTRYLHEEQPAEPLDGNDAFGAYVRWLCRAANRRVRNAAAALRQAAADGLSEQQAWARNGIVLTKAARAHTRIFIVESLIENVESIEQPAVAQLMHTVARVFILGEILKREAQFMEAGMTLESLQRLRQAQRVQLALMRKNAVPLVDAFDFPDRYLDSCLGRYDGQAYSAMIEFFKHSKLNQQQVLDAHKRHTGPMMAEARAML